MGNYKDIIVERRGGIAIVTLNRPQQMNAFTWRLHSELHDAFARLDLDDEIRCVVVTGAGKAFCVGAELNSSGSTFNPNKKDEALQSMHEENFKHCHPINVRKPIIAAINGHAVGVGITMPLQYDIRIVAEDAKLGFVFVRRGIIPELGSHWILPRMIGISKATELLLTGRLFSGKEAVDMGIASQAVPKEKVLETAISLAEEIAVNCAPVSVALTKRQLWAYLSQSNYVEAADTEQKYFDWTRTQPDSIEGVRAFMEKRQPAWSSKASIDLPSDIPSLFDK
ncbi:enoyl-CoA hydratase-related protein [Bacillus dakarensis]|uniref:enoyl-CoA hydratase-related protein n=1 Tax=Robertmurraya dakarensis TaxID=1926278 RepID=UPI0009822115|nr:enoyl-CoA hydratase-related protein [Bacillus dakarensis]